MDVIHAKNVSVLPMCVECMTSIPMQCNGTRLDSNVYMYMCVGNEIQGVDEMQYCRGE